MKLFPFGGDIPLKEILYGYLQNNYCWQATAAGPGTGAECWHPADCRAEFCFWLPLGEGAVLGRDGTSLPTASWVAVSSGQLAHTYPAPLHPTPLHPSPLRPTPFSLAPLYPHACPRPILPGLLLAMDVGLASLGLRAGCLSQLVLSVGLGADCQCRR